MPAGPGSAVASRTLDVGCGVKKYPGSIGIDRNVDSRADVLCDLDRFPYPFRDSTFAHIRAVHVIEHVSDVIHTMEEFHRLLIAGGEVYIATPHYTDFSSFCDPTHRLNSKAGLVAHDTCQPKMRKEVLLASCGRTRPDSA